MKKLQGIIFSVTLCFCSVIFADVSTQSTTTTTTIPTVPTTSPTGNAAPQTTTTTTVSETKVHDIDADIVNQLSTKLANDSALIGATVTGTSKDGIVTLEGDVTMQAQADEAVQVAKGIPGVKSVISNINVKTNTTKTIQPIVPKTTY